MNLMDKLRGLFLRADVPDETRQVFANAASLKEAMKGLETLRGQNEMELTDQESQLIAIEKAIMRAEERVRGGGLTPTEETTVLRQIERFEKQREIVDNLVAIYNGNVNLHLNLMSKIQEAEAMRLRGVTEDQIDQLIEDVEENLGEYRRVSMAAEAGEGAVAAVDRSEERKRLDAIRKRIVGASESSEPATAEPRPKKKVLE